MDGVNLFTLFAKIGLDASDFDKGLNNSKKSMADYKSDVMKLAQEYKKQGMSMSEAMKKAYDEIDKSQYDTAEASKTTASSFSANWSGAAESVKSAMSGAAGALGSALSAIGQAAAVGFGAATAAAVAFGTDAVNVGKQFDASMANVAAISGATGKEFDDLREKAIEMGGSTKFSATEAAEAMGFMAMAGWDTGEMIDGISGIMDLAAASGESLGATADIVTDALTAFGLEAQDSGHFADVLAVAASAANTDVGKMGETFKYVAPLAGAMGYQIEDMAETIGLMANAGIKASQAGTSLRTMISKLSQPTDDAIAVLQKLGLTVSEISAEEAAAQTKALEQSLKDKQKAYSDDEDALKQSLDRQYDALKKSLDQRYNAQKTAFEDACEARKKALDSEYEKAETAYDKDYEARKKSLDAEYDALEKRLDDEIDAVQRANEKTLADTEKAQEAAVKAYEKATEAKLELIDKEYQESLKNTDEAEYQRLKDLDDQIAKIQEASDAAAKAAEEEERKQRRAELQEAVNTADSAEKRREAKQKLADYEEKIRLKDAEAQRKADIADLKAKKDKVKEEAKAERDAAKEKLDADKKAYKEERAAGLEELKETNKQNLATLKEGQEADLKALKDSRKEQLDAAKEANAEDLKELKRLNDERLNSLKERNESELKSLKKSQSDQLSAIQDGNEETLKETKRGYDKQLDALKESNKEKLEEYQDYVKAQKERLKSQSAAQSILITDEKGRVREWNEVIDLLRGSFSGLSESEKVEAANALVGQEAASGFLAVMNATDKTVSDLRNEIAAASVTIDGFAEALTNNGYSLDDMRSAFARIGVTNEEFDKALKDSQGNVQKFRDALLDSADAGISESDVMDALGMSAEELGGIMREMSAAAEMAAIHEDSLAGSVTTLGSALETLKIRISDEITPALRKFTEFAQNSVVALTEAFESGGFAGMMDALGPVLEDGIGMLLSYVPAVAEVGGQLLGAVVTGLIHNLPILAEGALKLATEFGGYLLTAFRDVFSDWGLGEEFDAFVTSVSETFAKVRDAVTGAFERIKTAFSDAFGEYFSSGQAAQDATNLLTGAIELFGDAVSVAADFVATIVEKITGFVGWLSEGSTGADLFAAAVTGVVAAFAAFKIALGITTLIETFKKVILGAELAFRILTATMMANPLALIAALIAGVVAALITLWNTNEDFRNAVINIGNAIKDFVTGLVDVIVNFFTQTLPDALSALREFVSQKTEEIKNFFISLRDGIFEAFSNIGAWFNEKFTAAYNAVTSAWSGAGKWFSDRWTDISNAFNGAKEWFSTKFSDAWNCAKGAFGGVRAFFEGVWKDITGVFGNAFEWFKGIGKNIIDGLTAGIGGLWNGFISFLSGKTDEVKDEFEGEQGFDTHSPSKWAEKVFQNVLQGGEIGLDKGLPGILSGAENAVRDIQNALTADPFNVSGGYQLSGGYSYAPAPQLAAAGATSGAASAPIEIIIEPTKVVINERVLGEIVWKYIRTQQRAGGGKSWT